jgi:hypothetical protein
MLIVSKKLDEIGSLQTFPVKGQTNILGLSVIESVSQILISAAVVQKLL